MKRNTFLLFLGIAALFAACSSNEGEGELRENQHPTVWLSAGPPEGSTGKYRVQMFWGGWDPDGEIAGYEYLVTDNETGVFIPADTIGVPWRPVAGNDSIFTFSADQAVDTADTLSTVAIFTRSHTFFIRSIDTEGLKSRAPAYRSFTSRTLSPEVIIDIPVKNALNAIDVPPIPTFRWHARDYVDDLLISQDPDSVQYALIDTENEKVPGHGLNRFTEAAAYLNTRAGQEEWYPWVYYRAPGDSGKFWTVTPPLEGGSGGAAKTYVFAVRAKDEAGAITPVLDEFKNWRRIKVAARNRGPLMTVSNEYIGVIRTVSCATPVTILDSPAGVPLEFRVSADASDYGGLVAGYRYGWDIPNLDDPEQWEIDLTPFLPGTTSQTLPARTFFFGTHTLTIEVVDNSGYCSRIEIKVNIVQFTLERSLLIVDDDDLDRTETSGLALGVYPNDAEHDDFWMQMTSEVAGFDPEVDMIDVRSSGEIPLVRLSQYKSILWVVNHNVGTPTPTALLALYISHRQKNPPPGSTGGGGKVKPNILALAMAAGGHVMVAGTHPINLVITRPWRGVRFPLIFAYELEGDQHTPPPLTSDPLIGDLSFAYRDLCLDTIDYGVQNTSRIRKRNAGNGKIAYCPLDFIRPSGANSDRDDSMREAVPFDPNFESLTIRPEVSGPTNFYAPASRGLDAEVYNPAYFRRNSGKPGACDYVPPSTRPCFQPIYLLGSNDTAEPTYHQPVAFWSAAYENRVADVPGAIGARSLVFGFAPVLMNPSQVQEAMNYILYDEWQLPRGSSAAILRATAK